MRRQLWRAFSHVLLPSSQPNGLSWSSEGHIFASSSDDGTVRSGTPLPTKTRVLSKLRLRQVGPMPSPGRPTDI